MLSASVSRVLSTCSTEQAMTSTVDRLAGTRENEVTGFNKTSDRFRSPTRGKVRAARTCACPLQLTCILLLTCFCLQCSAQSSTDPSLTALTPSMAFALLYFFMYP